MAYQLMGGPQQEVQIPGAPDKAGGSQLMKPMTAPPPSVGNVTARNVSVGQGAWSSATPQPTQHLRDGRNGPPPSNMASNAYDYMLMNDGQMPKATVQPGPDGVYARGGQRGPGQQARTGPGPIQIGPGGTIAGPTQDWMTGAQQYYQQIGGADWANDPQWLNTTWQENLRQYQSGEMGSVPQPPVPMHMLPPGWQSMPPDALSRLPVDRILRGELPPDWWKGSEWDPGDGINSGYAPPGSGQPVPGSGQDAAGKSASGVGPPSNTNPTGGQPPTYSASTESQQTVAPPAMAADAASSRSGLPGPGGSGGPPSTSMPQGTYNQRRNPFPGTPFFGTDSSIIPGLMGNADSYDDYNNLVMSYLNLLGDRDMTEFGGSDGIGGNSVNRDGTWNAPDFLRNSAARYGEANTDAVTRNVTDGELVENRLTGLMREDNEINQMAKQDALAQAAKSGMLGSGVAAGAALRASRQAMMPIAQQDAQTVSGVESANMDARNRDRLADQQNRTGLLSQELGTSANLLDSATERRFRSDEANTERGYELMRDDLNFRRGTLDREDQQQFQWASREDEQEYNSWQRGLDREFEGSMRQLDRDFQGSEAEKQRVQQRVMAFYESTFGREGAMSNILASIYNNPNLTPEQQRAAAQNAQAIMGDLWARFNATLGQGVPDIFLDPYALPQEPSPPAEPPPNP